MKTGTPPLWPFRSRVRKEAAKAGVPSPQRPTRPATAQDREAAPAVRFFSKWEHWSKEAYSVPAIGLRAAEWGRYHWLRLTNQPPWPASWPKPALRRLRRQPSEASGPYVEGCIPSQIHRLSNLAQFAGCPIPRLSASGRTPPMSSPGKRSGRTCRVRSPKGGICLSRGREPAEPGSSKLGAAQRRHIDA